jgi:hypothetical protein
MILKRLEREEDREYMFFDTLVRRFYRSGVDENLKGKKYLIV